MSRIIVVEDDRSILDLVALYLRADGHDVETHDHGTRALHAVEARLEGGLPPDLIVLDLMLPGLDGRGIARRIRGVSDVPILMLTALDDDRDKIEGLELGADDYVTKPFNPNELVARVRAILRRAAKSAAPQEAEIASLVAAGNIAVDIAARRLAIGGIEVALRSKEFDLLAAFLLHPNRVLTRDQLLDRVWGGEFTGDTRTVDVHVSRLRERLAGAGATVSIDTVRSVGYRLSNAPDAR